MNLAACGRVGFDPVAGVTADGSINDQLVAWYPMDTDASAGSVVDASGNHHDGTCAASACPGLVGGMIGGAYTFDGANDRIDVVDDGRLDLVSEFTVTVWLRPNTTTGQTAVAKPRAMGPGPAWEVTLDPGNSPIYCTFDGAVEECLNGSVVVAPNVWTHAAISWNGTTKQLYLNAVKLAESTRTTAFDMTSLVIGQDFESPAFVNPFHGELDDIRIYGRALSPTEIQTVYALR